MYIYKNNENKYVCEYIVINEGIEKKYEKKFINNEIYAFETKNSNYLKLRFYNNLFIDSKNNTTYTIEDINILMKK